MYWEIRIRFCLFWSDTRMTHKKHRESHRKFRWPIFGRNKNLHVINRIHCTSCKERTNGCCREKMEILQTLFVDKYTHPFHKCKPNFNRMAAPVLYLVALMNYIYSHWIWQMYVWWGRYQPWGICSAICGNVQRRRANTYTFHQMKALWVC